MAKITTLQKLGIALLLISPLVGVLGTVISIYLSFSALDAANQNAGIGAVGNQITRALLFSAAGVVGCLIGLVMLIVGRRKKTNL